MTSSEPAQNTNHLKHKALNNLICIEFSLKSNSAYHETTLKEKNIIRRGNI